MKKWSVIAAAALVAAWLVVDTVRDFAANETISYFSTKPHRLLYVLAIALAGGFGALAFDRLSSQAQGRVRLFAWGAAASLLTGFIGCMVFCLASLPLFIIDSGNTAWALLALLLFTGIAGYLWVEFYRSWKRGGSR